ncbi:hypothetical protein MVEN_00205700 [Mycena venus]|uniref:F-box domain-containing protein n=1 Tax=Mycena venus TaxID=2733690 RepID=A0A8H6Z1S0_9AGAR|nr:hypothetical protein MVEN_00205700 [Mycena venus]
MEYPGLSGLPTELINFITGHSEVEDLLVLCRASRQIHAICLGWLYRAITLKSPIQLVKWGKTVVSRPEAADSVRELIIPFDPRDMMKSFYAVFGSAMKRLKNLQVLEICSPELLHTFPDTSFPRLSDCDIPVSVDIWPFLRSNPTITSLSILALDLLMPRSDIETLPTQSIHMPKLRFFCGPGPVARKVVPGTVVSRLAIFWPNKPVMEFSRDLAAVASSKAGILHLTCTLCRWDPALWVSIAKHVPRIKFLEIHVVTSSTNGKEEFLHAFDDSLRSLPSLIALTIMSPAHPPIEAIDQYRETTFATIRRWGELSPKLMRIVLPIAAVKITWLRAYGNTWVPRPKDCPEAMEAFNWLVQKISTSPELVAEYRSSKGT